MATKITDEHQLYTENKAKWKLVDDICNSENLQSYLIKINPTDTSPDNTARNKAYYERAVFYGITGHTSRGMTGLPFMKRPVLEVPELMDTVKTNVDGRGTSIFQQSKALLKSVVRKGRAGLFVDFPKVDSTVTLAQQKSKEIFPVIHRIEPDSIINWSITQIGAVVMLSRVVWYDSVENMGKIIPIIKEAMIDESGLYILNKWEKDESGEWNNTDTSEPKDGKSNRLNFIPFTFVGSENNTYTIDYSPLYGMANIEVGHYNNSAEHEDVVFLSGQPQPWMSGLDEATADLFRKHGLYIGCGKLMPVPSGEQFGFAQIETNDAALNAMEKKEEKMLALGAMMVQPGTSTKTATEAEGEMQTNYSVLSLCVSNVNDAYNLCLQWYALFQNAPTANIKYEIREDFIPKVLDPQLLSSVLNAFMGSAVSRSAWIRFLQRYNIEEPEKTVEDISEEIGEQVDVPNLDDTTTV